MEFKTESGVSITIIREGNSIILSFNRSIRALGLTKKEVKEINTCLSQNLLSKKNGRLISGERVGVI